MKTHDLAKSLELLAEQLKNERDVDVGNVKSAFQVRNSDYTSDAFIAVNLRTLVQLSKIDKSRWKEFINEHNLPIEVKTTYSVRDLLGKILNYLEKNPQEFDNMRQRVVKKTGSTSDELDKAFEMFLSEDFK